MAPAHRVRPGPSLIAVVLIVFCSALARDECAPPRPLGRWPADLGLGAVDAQLHAGAAAEANTSSRVRSRMPGCPGTANPRAASSGRTWRTARVTVARSTR